jgi:hypothetical protein
MLKKIEIHQNNKYNLIYIKFKMYNNILIKTINTKLSKVGEFCFTSSVTWALDTYEYNISWWAFVFTSYKADGFCFTPCNIFLGLLREDFVFLSPDCTAWQLIGTKSWCDTYKWIFKKKLLPRQLKKIKFFVLNITKKEFW